MADKAIEFSSEEAEEYLLDITKTSTAELAKAIWHTNPIETHILRSHLWVEREIDQILEQLFPYPEAILDARFTFSHKLSLLKGFWGNETHRVELLSKLNALNQIRNQMAHKLNSSKLHGLFKKIGVNYQLDDKNQPSEKLYKLVQIKLADLQGSIIGIKGTILLEKAGHTIVATES